MQTRIARDIAPIARPVAALRMVVAEIVHQLVRNKVNRTLRYHKVAALRGRAARTATPPDDPRFAHRRLKNDLIYRNYNRFWHQRGSIMSAYNAIPPTIGWS